MEKFWFVCDLALAPFSGYAHGTVSHALEEAEQAAKRHPDRFYFVACATTAIQAHTKTTIETVDL